MANILLIDDDEALRDVLAIFLGEADHEVRLAANGKQGLMLFKQSPADVVVTDLIMPEQEGIETITALRKLNPRLPIIAISGGVVHAPAYLKVAAKLGAHRALAKPFTSEELLQAIAGVLAEVRGGDPV